MHACFALASSSKAFTCWKSSSDLTKLLTGLCNRIHSTCWSVEIPVSKQKSRWHVRIPTAILCFAASVGAGAESAANMAVASFDARADQLLLQLQRSPGSSPSKAHPAALSDCRHDRFGHLETDAQAAFSPNNARPRAVAWTINAAPPRGDAHPVLQPSTKPRAGSNTPAAKPSKGRPYVSQYVSAAQKLAEKRAVEAAKRLRAERAAAAAAHDADKGQWERDAPAELRYFDRIPAADATTAAARSPVKAAAAAAAAAVSPLRGAGSKRRARPVWHEDFAGAAAAAPPSAAARELTMVQEERRQAALRRRSEAPARSLQNRFAQQQQQQQHLLAGSTSARRAACEAELAWRRGTTSAQTATAAAAAAGSSGRAGRSIGVQTGSGESPTVTTVTQRQRQHSPPPSLTERVQYPVRCCDSSAPAQCSRGTRPFEQAVVQRILALEQQAVHSSTTDAYTTAAATGAAAGDRVTASHRGTTVAAPLPPWHSRQVQWSDATQQHQQQQQDTQQLQLKLMTEMTRLMRAVTGMVNTNNSSTSSSSGSSSRDIATAELSKADRELQQLQTQFAQRLSGVSRPVTAAPATAAPATAATTTATAAHLHSTEAAQAPATAVNAASTSSSSVKLSEHDAILAKILDKLNKVEAEEARIRNRYAAPPSAEAPLTLPLGVVFQLASECESPTMELLRAGSTEAYEDAHHSSSSSAATAAVTAALRSPLAKTSTVRKQAATNTADSSSAAQYCAHVRAAHATAAVSSGSASSSSAQTAAGTTAAAATAVRRRHAVQHMDVTLCSDEAADIEKHRQLFLRHRRIQEAALTGTGT
eukprot:14504-Heterococcus_DN1.PRE.3